MVMIGILCFNVPASAQQSQGAAQVEATVHLDEEGAPVNPFVYGMFTELLSNMFENGVLAEMLSDRKFFYPVDNSETLTPTNSKRHQLRWRPVGGAVEMDTKNVYVGKHSPKVTVAGGRAGMRQAGLWLVKGKGYDGRIALSGEGPVTVRVSLVWGPGASDRETVTISNLSKAYKKYTFHFTAGADVQDAALEIVGEGNGYFEVGAVSLMPDDNISGLRSDLVAILREVGSPVYRWPGGNVLANYDWRHGIGDPDQRPPRYDYAWNTVESNDMGTDEYLKWCELIGCEPYLVVNIGFGDSFSAAQWVEYVNGAENTPMGRLRAANGHPKPYGVKYWGIGNEMYGEWQLGHMSSAHYTIKHNFFAEEMLAKDPSIVIVGCGATVYETSTTARHHRTPLQTPIPIPYLSEFDWTGSLLMRSLDGLDHVSEHIYPNASHYYDKATGEWVRAGYNFYELTRQTPNRIKGMVEAMQYYEEHIPGVKEKHPQFWVDEWVSSSGRGFATTLGVATALHEFIRNSYYIMMGGYTGFNGLYVYNDVDAVISSRGLLFKLFLEHQGKLPLKLDGNSPQKELKGTICVDLDRACGQPDLSDGYRRDEGSAEERRGGLRRESFRGCPDLQAELCRRKGGQPRYGVHPRVR